MKKLFVALFALTMLVSCSDNDSDSTQITQKKYVTTMTIGEDEDADVITFQYDDNKNLIAYLEDGDVEYTFTYNDNNELVTVTDASDESASVEIQYTNGVLSGYKADGSTFPITYNESTKKYLFGGDLGVEIGLEGRDLGTVAETGGENYITIDYFDDFKGPMYNVPTKDIFLVSLFTDLYYLTSTKSISGMNDEGQNYSTESTYDEDGYVTKMILKSGTETEDVVTFQYSEL